MNSCGICINILTQWPEVDKLKRKMGEEKGFIRKHEKFYLWGTVYIFILCVCCGDIFTQKHKYIFYDASSMASSTEHLFTDIFSVLWSSILEVSCWSRPRGSFTFPSNRAVCCRVCCTLSRFCKVQILHVTLTA